MPRIDEFKLDKSKFKKTSVRSWDTDLVSSLKISNSEASVSNEDAELHPNKKNTKEATSDKSAELHPNKKNTKEATSDKSAELHPNKKNTKEATSDNRAELQFNPIQLETRPSFLSDEFRFRKTILRTSGVEKNLLLLLLNICIKNNSLKTGSISGEDFDAYLGISRNTRESAIKRLCKKGLIKRMRGKTGLKGTLNLSFTSELALKVAHETYSEEGLVV